MDISWLDSADKPCLGTGFNAQGGGFRNMMRRCERFWLKEPESLMGLLFQQHGEKIIRHQDPHGHTQSGGKLV